MRALLSMSAWIWVGCAAAPSSRPTPAPTPAPHKTVTTTDIEIKSGPTKPHTIIITPSPDDASDPHERDVRLALQRADELFDQARTPTDLLATRDNYLATIRLAGRDHPLMGIMRFKLAWTLYRVPAFAAAFDTFWDLVDEPSLADLRIEVLQYLAIITLEPSWDDDGKPDAMRGLDRPEIAVRLGGGAPWLAEFLAEVGHMQELDGDHAGAARAYQMAAIHAKDPEARRRYQQLAKDIAEPR